MRQRPGQVSCQDDVERPADRRTLRRRRAIRSRPRGAELWSPPFRSSWGQVDASDGVAHLREQHRDGARPARRWPRALTGRHRSRERLPARHALPVVGAATHRPRSRVARRRRRFPQTLLCTHLSAVLLTGLLLNSTLGWGWRTRSPVRSSPPLRSGRASRPGRARAAVPLAAPATPATARTRAAAPTAARVPAAPPPRTRGHRPFGRRSTTRYRKSRATVASPSGDHSGAWRGGSPPRPCITAAPGRTWAR